MKRTLPYFENEFLFFTHVFLIFFRHFLFLFITFRFHLFFISFYVWSDLQFFFWTTISPSFCIKKTLQLIPFSCMRYLCMSFCSWICSSVVFFFLFVFLVSNTFVSLFLLLFALSITSLKKSLWNCCESEKHLFVYLPFCWALVSHLFVFACVFVSKFHFFDIF